MATKVYNFRGKIWKYKGQASWHFITLPKTTSREIRKFHGTDEEGWGRLKTTAKIGNSEWRTAIWYDSKFDAYLLPIKAQVRKAEKIQLESQFAVKLKFEFSNTRGWITR